MTHFGGGVLLLAEEHLRSPESRPTPFSEIHLTLGAMRLDGAAG